MKSILATTRLTTTLASPAVSLLPLLGCGPLSNRFIQAPFVHVHTQPRCSGSGTHQHQRSRQFSTISNGPPKPVKTRKFTWRAASFTWGVTLTLTALSAFAILPSHDEEHKNEPQLPVSDSTEHVNDLDQVYLSISEIAKHDANAERQWVVHGSRVYDITDFIETHPGGQVILRACGGSIDPYWKLFSIHNKPEVLQILEQYYIGDVNPKDLTDDGKINWTLIGMSNELEDPFSNDPQRDPRLIVHTAKPCNAEIPPELLAESFITPTELFYVRHHLWVPDIDPQKHKLTLEFSDGEESIIALADLKSQFKEHQITATLQCSGNRRKHMSENFRGKTSGLPWGIGAISNAEFTGVKLCDVLRKLGYDESKAEENEDRHIHFSSSDDTYAVSIPLATALAYSSDVLLAWEMNGKPINRDHGGPLRVVVPGTTAARSVKWVDRITVSSEEASGQYQKHDYKCFGPNVKAADLSEEDWEREQSIQETPVQSAITAVQDKGDKVLLKGFAFSGGGRAIARVDITADGGKTWNRAEQLEDHARGSKRWAWSLWNIELPKAADAEKPVYMVKATDDAYNTQPESFDATWNFRGCLANAWHRVGPEKYEKKSNSES